MNPADASERAPDPFGGDRTYDGIEISSRWQKVDEVGLMLAIAAAIHPKARPFVRLIFCDSKASAEYLIELRDNAPAGLPEYIAELAGQTLLARAGGYNGIQVSCRADETRLDANWSGYHDQ